VANLRNSTHAAKLATSEPRVLSLSTEFPNPIEPGKGLFVRARLRAMAARVPLTVIAPVALLDYANPNNELLASLKIPNQRLEEGIEILHPRWIYPPKGGWFNAFCLFGRLLWPIARLRKRHGYNILDAHYAHPEGVAAALIGWALRMPVSLPRSSSGVSLAYMSNHPGLETPMNTWFIVRNRKNNANVSLG